MSPENTRKGDAETEEQTKATRHKVEQAKDAEQKKLVEAKARDKEREDAEEREEATRIARVKAEADVNIDGKSRSRKRHSLSRTLWAYRESSNERTPREGVTASSTRSVHR